MAAPYPTDYPFNVDNEGWPEHVYAPPYPFEYYYDNGRNPHENESKSEVNHHHHRPNSNYILPLAIRRHTPGSTDPSSQQLSSRSRSPITNSRFTAKRNASQPKSHSVPVRNHSSASSDPDERPIKPMKDISVYNKPPSQKKNIQPKKPPPLTPKPMQSPHRYESDSFRSPTRYESDIFQSPPSRNQMSTISQRRPIRTELIPKTPFGIPSKRHKLRPIIVEEYANNYPVTYVRHIPEKVVSYKEVSGMTTRELENYQMSKARRVVRVRSPPVETIIYQT